MFTGIVTALEKPIRIDKKDNSMELTLPTPKCWEVKEGDSISIDGICATVKAVDVKSFSVFFIPETIARTSLKYLSDNHAFNLEKPLSLNDLLDGHMVSGHIDTTATVQKIEDAEDSKNLTFTIDQKFTRYIIYKGSICINGTSMTVTKVDKETFGVSVIPYTLGHTNLGNLQEGDRVNIEVDMIAKYIEKYMEPYLTHGHN